MNLKDLLTEQRNPATEMLDMMTPLELVSVMNREDSTVPSAIELVLPEVACAIEAIAAHLARGGRLIYVGTGTSGRIGTLDASECPPTFGTDPEMVRCLIAGGSPALVRSSEESEDSAELGTRDMAYLAPGETDVVVGIAASGRTPYTVAALDCARAQGAFTIALSCNKGSPLGEKAQIRIEVEVGPEVLTGSSRLKAGTAQKLICNMLSTGAMVRLGFVFSNFMVNLSMKNEKLIERGVAILQCLTNTDSASARRDLEAAEMKLPVALVMLKTGKSRLQSIDRLIEARGNVRLAVEME